MRRKTTVEQDMAPAKFVETTIVSMETVEEDVDTIKVKFSFGNKARFKKKFYKYSWEYISYWKKKQPGDKVTLVVRASTIQNIV